MGDEVRGSGYDQYVTDARRQVEDAARACTAFDWPREAAATERTETSSSDSRSEADPSRGWHEGAFLAMVLDRLSGCLDMDYDANLGLTSVVARLAQLPPTVPLVPGARTLFTVLKEVVANGVLRS